MSTTPARSRLGAVDDILDGDGFETTAAIRGREAGRAAFASHA